MKMSYEACVQHRTLKELFLLAILKTYHQRKRLGLVELPYPDITKKMINGIRCLCFKKLTEKSMKEEAKEKERDRIRKLGTSVSHTLNSPKW